MTKEQLNLLKHRLANAKRAKERVLYQDPTEPPEVVAAKAVIDAWEKTISQNRAREDEVLEKEYQTALEEILFGTKETALAAVKKFEEKVS